MASEKAGPRGRAISRGQEMQNREREQEAEPAKQLVEKPESWWWGGGCGIEKPASRGEQKDEIKRRERNREESDRPESEGRREAGIERGMRGRNRGESEKPERTSRMSEKPESRGEREAREDEQDEPEAGIERRSEKPELRGLEGE
ncbi:hypothetical protein BJ508DRAFT_316046 [Ascobolus immersus RN42]|uniref:Uncharacterized protein n=1 Tax=Ascobolus immersus RN42 TaxID=1160509 RepID=A0A3N4HAS3_ASCIM|nr:hypothetical protein BJ508DRAFT_316046 [Ascobolus immersus RN42]